MERELCLMITDKDITTSNVKKILNNYKKIALNNRDPNLIIYINHATTIINGILCNMVLLKKDKSEENRLEFIEHRIQDINRGLTNLGKDYKTKSEIKKLFVEITKSGNMVINKNKEKKLEKLKLKELSLKLDIAKRQEKKINEILYNRDKINSQQTEDTVDNWEDLD